MRENSTKFHSSLIAEENGRTLLLLLLVKMSKQIIRLKEEEQEPTEMVILQVEIDGERMEPMDIKEEQGLSERMNENTNPKEKESVSEMKQDGMVEDDSLKKFHCSICNKRFAKKTNFNRHVSEVHERVKKSNCKICSKQFTCKVYRNYHLKHTKSHNRLIRDEFQFKSFITGQYHYRHIWTLRVSEYLTTDHECDNTYDEFAVSTLKNNDTIVGHTPTYI